MSLHQVFIGIGSNIEREFHTREAYRVLHQYFDNVVVSPVYDCPAEGFDGPGFYNWVALVCISYVVTICAQPCLSRLTLFAALLDSICPVSVPTPWCC